MYTYQKYDAEYMRHAHGFELPGGVLLEDDKKKLIPIDGDDVRQRTTGELRLVVDDPVILSKKPDYYISPSEALRDIAMELLDQYFAIQQKIYEYFGYIEDWRVMPLNDDREMFWSLDDDCDEKASSVIFHEEREAVEDAEGDHYSDDIFTYRHLSKYVYRAQDYTMILCDTHTDGNIFLRVFDNAKEIK